MLIDLLPKDVFMLQPYQLEAFGCRVHAQRARKLRQRGERVLRVGTTVNGKPIFSWFGPARFRMPRVVIMKPRRPEPRNDLVDAFMFAWAAAKPKRDPIDLGRLLNGEMLESKLVYETTPSGCDDAFFRHRWIPRAEYEATWIGVDPAEPGGDTTSGA